MSKAITTEVKQLEDIEVAKITWRKFTADGVEIHEVSNPDAYRAEGKQVLVLPAKRKAEPTYYVYEVDYTKPTTRTTKSAKLSSELAGVDLTAMTAEELAQMQAKLAAILG